MTNKSLEALDTLKDEIIPDYALEYEDDEGYKNWVIELYQTIKQDLERKEVLELNLDSEKYNLVNENQCLKNRVEDLEICFFKQINENQELKYKLFKTQPLEEENKRMFDVNQKLQKELETEKLNTFQFLEDFKKLKIAIKILKENLCIEFNDSYNGVSFKKDKYDECDYTVLCLNLKSQYDLLKEMLKK